MKSGVFLVDLGINERGNIKLDRKEIGYKGVGWFLVVLYIVQRVSAFKYGNEFLTFTAFENFFRPGGRLLDFQEQESLLNERRVALIII
jgi:hypothetical protein